MTWLPGTAEGDKLLDHLAKHGKAGIIIANSLRADVPEFIAKGEEKRLIKGVICGEHLYDGTISLIDQLKEQCDSRSIPIVASGGMVTEDQILNALRRGAKAVQLCTAFDYFEMQYYRTLRSSLRARIHAQGLSKFAVYMERLPKMGIASVQNIPFLYFERFYSKEAQQTLLADVQTSIRMDISVLSGYSLFNNKKWRAALWARFEDNLGMRFYVPHVNSEAYRAIQLSWGITDGAQIEARKDHLIKAVEGIVNLWKETAKKRKESVRERNETAKKDAKAGSEIREATLEIVQHAQCPFDSVYLFDGKVYIAPYPLVWQEEFASPVYAFYGRTLEYERRSADLERVYTKTKHTGGLTTL